MGNTEKSWSEYLTLKLESSCGLPREEAAKQAGLLLKWIRRYGVRLARQQTNAGQECSSAHPPLQLPFPLQETRGGQRFARAAHL